MPGRTHSGRLDKAAGEVRSVPAFADARDARIFLRDFFEALLSRQAPRPADRIESCHELRGWHQSADRRETLVERYLNGRGLDLPSAGSEVIRFHPNCPFEKERFPAMVCLVRGIISNEPQAIHRTALAPDGTAIKRNDKTYRLSLGAVTGGVIMVSSDEDVTQGLCRRASRAGKWVSGRSGLP
jgi:hypothetical protein